MQILVGVLIGAYVLLYAALNLPVSRAFLTGVATRMLSEKLHTHVDVGDLEIGLFNRVMLHDVRLDDQQHRPMLTSRLISAKIDLRSLLLDKRIVLHTISLLDLDVRLVQQHENAAPNFQFVLDAFKSKKTDKKTPLDLRINSLIIRRSNISWERTFMPRKGPTIDMNHLRIKDLDASISLKVLTEDSLNLRVRHMSLNEQSGLQIKRLTLRLAADRSHCFVAGVKVELPNSNFEQNNLSLTYDMKRFLSTLRVRGTLQRSHISLSDLTFLLPQNKQADDLAFHVSSQFNLSPSHWTFTQTRLQSTDGLFSLSAHVTLTRSPHERIDVTRLRLSADPLFIAKATARMSTKPLPPEVERIGRFTLTGRASYAQKRMDFDGKLTTDAGELTGNGNYAQGEYAAQLRTRSFDLGRVLADTTRFGNIAFDLSVVGKGRKNLSVKGQVSQFRFNHYNYRHITLAGTWDGKRIRTKLETDDPNLRLSIHGVAALPDPLDALEVTADVPRCAPHALGWTPQYASTVFAGHLSASLKGGTWSRATGTLCLKNLRMETPDTLCTLDSLLIEAGTKQGRHYIRLHSDFAQADYLGTHSLQESIPHVTSYLSPYLPTLFPSSLGPVPPVSNGRFNLHITNTRWLSKLFNLPVTLNHPFTAQGYWTEQKSFSLSAHTRGLSVGETDINDVKIYGRGDGRQARAVVQATKPMKNSDVRTSVELLASGDSVMSDLTWTDSNEQKYRGDVHFISDFHRFTPEQREVSVDLLPGRVYINDTLWNVGQGRLNWAQKRLHIHHFNLSHKNQQLSLQGNLEHSKNDTLAVTLKDIEVGYIMDLINFHAVDFAGRATGHVFLTNTLDDPHVMSRLDISDFRFNQAPMGSMAAEARWNSKENQIDIAAIMAERGLSQTYINGHISPKRKGLDLRFQTNNTNIQFINRYLDGIFTNMSGRASGDLRLYGPFKQLDLEGKQAVHMDCRVVPTGVDYTIESDSVIIRPGSFNIYDIRLTDSEGGRGYGQGALRHNHLHDLNYDFSLHAQDLKAYDRPKELDMPFYSTAYVTGSMHMEGHPGSFSADINVRPERGTQITYILNRPETTNSSQLITFRDRNLLDTAKDSPAPNLLPEPAATKTDIRLNFLIDMTPDASARVLMDENSGDAIDLNGEGAIRASFYNKGDFQLFGSYNVRRGTYKLSLQDLIRKEFTIQPGSSITFVGDPGNSDLNLQAVYTVNSASLADLNIGSNFSNSTVRVNCLLNVNGKVSAPQLSFDLDLPTVNEDEKQMVRSIISTEEDMNMQIIYLLSVGRFYTYDYGATATASTQSQSSVAMKSFLSNTLTGQLNNIISNAIGSSNWSFGTNLSTGEVGWSDMEVEGLLSGRLLNNRLLINGNFGYRDRAAYSTGFVGDFDIQWLLTPNGNISLKAYSESNDRYFTKSSLTTQGIGLQLKRDFIRFGDMFRWLKKDKNNNGKKAP